MHPSKNLILLTTLTLCLCCKAQADFKITIPDVVVTSDGVNPTSGSFDILLEVDGAGSPNVSAPISSYNFQLDVTAFGGGLTTVSSLTASEGVLFSGVSSQPFVFSTFSQGTSPLGYSEGTNTLAQLTAPAPATVNSPIVLTQIDFTIPAGQTGSFQVDFLPDSVEFFDDATPSANLYLGVTATGGTITAIPEPNAFLLFAAIGTICFVGKRWRQRRVG